MQSLRERSHPFHIGNSQARELLFGCIAAGSPHAFLLTGPTGLGKATLAAAAVRQALGRVPRSVDLDVKIFSGIEKIGIDDVRAISHHVSRRPIAAPRSVVVIEDANRMTPEAANALLVTLESPPGYALLLLTAPSAEHVLPTIRSRCVPIALHLVSEKTIYEGLLQFVTENKTENKLITEKQKLSLDKQKLADLAKYAMGRPGRALSRLVAPETKTSIADSTAVWVKSDLIARLKLAGTLSANPQTARDFLGELMLTAPASLRPGLAIAERRLRRNVSSRAVLEAFAMLEP